MNLEVRMNWMMLLYRWMLVVCSLCIAACSATAPTNKAPGAAMSSDPMPVFAKGSRILFQGDSITDGNRGRNADPNHILGHGYQFIISCKFGEELAERNLLFMNRGVSGDTVARLSRRWQTDTISLKPDILSILIGVNDLAAGVSVQDYQQQYDQLLADTVKALPNVKLVLCEPFGLPVGRKKDSWESYRADLEMRQRVVAKLAEKYHAAFVPFQQAFDEATKRMPADYWIWDGIHPTYSGHQLIANEWITIVRGHWADGR
jgi:lysophospholipase L1-like esterase